jgi:hypothetical protein
MVVEVGHIDGIAQKGFVDLMAVPLTQLKMQLVNVEGVYLERAILDNPVFNITLVVTAATPPVPVEEYDSCGL